MSGNKRDVNVKMLAADFMQNTTMHGLGRLTSRPGWPRKIMWLVAILCAAGVAVFNIQKVVKSYLQYEVNTVLTMEYSAKIIFPSVTICNINSIRNSKLGDTNIKEKGETQENMATNFEVFDWDSIPPHAYDEYGEEFEANANFQEDVALLPNNVKMTIGHQLSEIMLNCFYQGKLCTPKNFTSFYNYMYGNCFTFTPRGEQSQYITRPGPLYGLSLVLNAEEKEYITRQSDTVGFKVVIHSADTMPFPEDEGFVVAPGSATSVGVTKVKIMRAGPPYGNCLNYGLTSGFPPNIFTNLVEKLSYSDKACTKTCYQKIVIDKCNCCDSIYPCSKKDRAIITTDPPEKMEFCSYKSETNGTATCAANAKLAFETDDVPCGACVQNCQDETHNVEISSAIWPFTGRVNDVLKAVLDRALANGNQSLDYQTEGAETFIRRNVLKLEIFYKQLNYQIIETKPAYDWSSFLSDLGGQAGLWLGFSIMTVCEFIELIVDIIMYLINKPFTTEVKPM